jgi:hypothetical protein
VVLALAALGIDPHTDEDFIKNDGSADHSLLAGLLALQNGTNDYFGLDYLGKDDEFSTEQAFCALMAAVLQSCSGAAQAVHPYEFKNNPAVPGVASGLGEKPVIKDPDSTNPDITVYFTLKGPDGIWINKSGLVLKQDAKVYHAVIEGLKKHGYRQSGAESGYVSSITKPDGKTLAEFDYGSDSGWLYKVNDYLPSVALTSYGVSNGDHIMLYYTVDLPPLLTYGQAGADTADAFVRIKAALGEDGQATALLSGTELSDFVTALAKSKDVAGSVATLAVDMPDGAQSLSVTLPQTALSALGKTKNTALALQSSLGEVKFDTSTLAQLVAAAAKGDLALDMALAKSAGLPADQRDMVGERPVYAFGVKAGGQAVSAFKGQAELFLPYAAAEGEDIGRLTVYHFGAAGQAEKIGDATYHSGRKGMVCSAKEFSLFAVAYEEAEQYKAYFTDVPAEHWAASYIYGLAEQGVIRGKTPALFVPNDSLTRAELTAMLFRLSGEELPQAAAAFADVAETAWYARELTWAVEAGIIRGVGEQRFAPQQAVSRQDMALMLMRYAIGRSLALPPREQLHTFSDDAAIGAYAAQAVSALQLAGLIKGYEDGSFRPQGKVSRAEAAKLLALIGGL